MSFTATFQTDSEINAKLDPTEVLDAELGTMYNSGVDVSNTTAVAGDVKSGKKFHIADGSLETGSYLWNWMGDEWELIDDDVYHSSALLKDTAFHGWTASTTALAIEASRSLTARAINTGDYEYLLRWRFDSNFEYLTGVTMKAVPIHQSIEMFQAVIKRPNALPDMTAGTCNGNACPTLLTVPIMDYYNTSGTHTLGYTGSYGCYAGANAATFSSATSNTPNMTIKTPTVSVRCNSSYFATARGAYVDEDNSGYKLVGMLYRTSKGGAVRTMYDYAGDLYRNPLT